MRPKTSPEVVLAIGFKYISKAFSEGIYNCFIHE